MPAGQEAAGLVQVDDAADAASRGLVADDAVPSRADLA